MLLYIDGKLFSVCLFQGFYGLIVIFEIFKLPLVVFASLVKFFLYFLQVHLHILSFFFVLFFKFGFAFLHLLLIQIVVLLAILAFLEVLLFQLPDFFFCILAFLELGYLVLLFQNDFVGLLQHYLHFFFVAAAESLLRQLILLILRVQLKDNFGKLRDLFRHLVMRLLRDTCALRHLI